jgi:hypothetical protein
LTADHADHADNADKSWLLGELSEFGGGCWSMTTFY